MIASVDDAADPGSSQQDRIRRPMPFPATPWEDDEFEIISLEHWESVSRSNVSDPRQERALSAVEDVFHEQDERERPPEAWWHENAATASVDEMREVIQLMRQVQTCQEEREHPPTKVRFRLARLRDHLRLPLDTTLL